MTTEPLHRVPVCGPRLGAEPPEGSVGAEPPEGREAAVSTLGHGDHASTHRPYPCLLVSQLIVPTTVMPDPTAMSPKYKQVWCPHLPFVASGLEDGQEVK